MFSGGEDSMGYGPVGHPMAHRSSVPMSDAGWNHSSQGSTSSPQEYLIADHSPDDAVPYPTPPHSFGRSSSASSGQLHQSLEGQMEQFSQQIDGSTGPIRSARRQTRLSSRDVAGPVSDVWDRYPNATPQLEENLRYESRRSSQTLIHGISMSPPQSYAPSPYQNGPQPFYSPGYGPRSASPTLSVVSGNTSVSSHRDHRPYLVPRAYPSTPPPTFPQKIIVRDKSRKQRLFDHERKEICRIAEAHPHWRQEDIANMFHVERSTISKVLKDKKKWLALIDSEEAPPPTRASHRPPKFSSIEDAMMPWLQEMTDAKTPLTDNLIHDKALEVARILCEENMDRAGDREKFKASSGWVENFRVRHGIKRGIWNPKDGKDPKSSKNKRSTKTTEPEGPEDDRGLEQSTSTDLDQTLVLSATESTISSSTTETAFSETMEDGNENQDHDMELHLKEEANGPHPSNSRAMDTTPYIVVDASEPLSYDPQDTAQASAALSYLLEYWDQRPDMVSLSTREELLGMKHKIDNELRDERTPGPPGHPIG